MSAPAVRPELGPSLPTLLAPLPRAARLAPAAVVALVVAVVAWTQLAGGSAAVERIVVADGPVSFNIAAGTGLSRMRAEPGEALRLATASGDTPAMSVTVAPVALGAYRGDPIAALLPLSARRTAQLRAALPGFVLRGEGRTRVNEQPGLQLLFQFRMDGRLAYGRSVLLVPAEEVDPKPRRGVLLELRTQRSDAVPRVDSVGNNGVLKTSLRSFRFGTDAP